MSDVSLPVQLPGGQSEPTAAAPAGPQFQAAFASIQQQHDTAAASSPDMPTAAAGAPQLIEGFGDQRVKQGDSVTFSCVITGNPKPKVSTAPYYTLLLMR